MKKKVQLFAAPFFAAAFIFAVGFTPVSNTIVNGGGFTADGKQFNFNAVENSTGTVGHFQYADASYDVQCVIVSGNTATIFFTDNIHYAVVVDGGEGKKASPDMISDVQELTTDESPCQPILTQPALNTVAGGNIQVH